jgi:hypothetical protein
MSGIAMWTHPMKLPSCANLREHWAVRARRMRSHRNIGDLLTRRTASSAVGAESYAVLLTRIGVRKLDSDNLASACKGIRDGVADALGIDDGSERIEWSYEQRTCKRGEERVTCQIKWSSESCQMDPVEPAPTSEVKAVLLARTATKRMSAKRSKRTGVGR